VPIAPLVLLAQDERGYANLCRLITDAHMLGDRGDPAITTSQICAHPAGLVAIATPRSRAEMAIPMPRRGRSEEAVVHAR
jgi:DNA polymerase III alpha subunit